MSIGSIAPAGTDHDALSRVDTIHTLGPTGTNLERASHHWFAAHGREGAVVLHEQVEHSLDAMRFDGTEGVLTCAVYPALHDLVFGNLHRLAFVDAFILDTHSMVLATRPGQGGIDTIVTHPAPSCLVTERGRVTLTSSNSAAAAECAAGEHDACVTTAVAAGNEGLVIVEDFGPVPMVFTLHAGRPDVGGGPR